MQTLFVFGQKGCVTSNRNLHIKLNKITISLQIVTHFLKYKEMFILIRRKKNVYIFVQIHTNTGIRMGKKKALQEICQYTARRRTT